MKDKTMTDAQRRERAEREKKRVEGLRGTPGVEVNKCFTTSKQHRIGCQMDHYTPLKVIGRGSYGKVYLVRAKFGKRQTFAIKMLRKENIMKRNQVVHTKTERTVLDRVNHPFIVSLHYAFQTSRKLFFVLEYCPGGELFFHLQAVGRFSESRARFYSSEICLAIAYLHSLDIIYRDLKPENVLLDCNGHVKVTDFGLSKEGIADNFSANSMCGTPEYLAPEILLLSGHGKAVDWYSLGAICFEMITGLPPYYSRDREELFRAIRQGQLAIPSYVKTHSRDFLKRLLERTPSVRLGAGPTNAEEVKSHSFFNGVDWKKVYHRRYRPPFVPPVKDEEDVRNIDQEFLAMCLNASEYQPTDGSEDVLYFNNFSYVALPGEQSIVDTTTPVNKGDANHSGRTSGHQEQDHESTADGAEDTTEDDMASTGDLSRRSQPPATQQAVGISALTADALADMHKVYQGEHGMNPMGSPTAGVNTHLQNFLQQDKQQPSYQRLQQQYEDHQRQQMMLQHQQQQLAAAAGQHVVAGAGGAAPLVQTNMQHSHGAGDLMSHSQQLEHQHRADFNRSIQQYHQQRAAAAQQLVDSSPLAGATLSPPAARLDVVQMQQVQRQQQMMLQQQQQQLHLQQKRLLQQQQQQQQKQQQQAAAALQQQHHMAARQYSNGPQDQYSSIPPEHVDNCMTSRNQQHVSPQQQMRGHPATHQQPQQLAQTHPNAVMHHHNTRMGGPPHAAHHPQHRYHLN
ncbi:unnamed protein product [Amoebophrya sp. A25]|nr:unnamed protein product [Amoebophrya sp. A25]|eukprot:GSA25T00001863001.1